MPDFKDQPDLGTADGATDHGFQADSEQASPVVHLSDGFVEQQGLDAAQDLASIVTNLSAETESRDLEVIRAELQRRLDAAGVAVPPVEVDRYAERIARSEDITLTTD